MNNKILGIIIVLVAIASFLGGATYTQWQYQKGGAGPKVGVTPSPTAQQPSPTIAVLGELSSTIGNFSVLNEKICEEDGKPIIYFFGSKSCPHCSWEHPIFEEVMTQFGDLVSSHNNMDTNQDMDIFQKYSQINNGGIPFLVLGCQYARVGSGELSGEKTEKENLTALVCKLTNNQPEKVCASVQDLIDQIK
jgi:thiol-disulfide isomerase/thioredoxin